MKAENSQQIPSKISQLIQLKELALSDNQITTVPYAFYQLLSHLEFVSL
ncbi:MAG: hypothetical protein K1000chlam2_00504 [Chlamydiae bacterium]|nr:hypothetical protein [Chlamydiota bacterium]